MQHIIKRRGHTEPYDGRKLYASVYAACQTMREPTGSSELIAEKVVANVEQWLSKKHEVTSNDLRHQAALHLRAYHPEAGYIFLHHRVIW